MSDKNSLILDHRAISQKVERMAYQILEENYDEKEIVLIGIKDQGYAFAKLLHKQLKAIAEAKLSIYYIEVNKFTPSDVFEYDFDPKEMNGKTIILVDDVANSGRTMCYALRPLLSLSPKKIQTAVLVDRQHKSFPIHTDHVGLRLNTTMKEHVTVELGKKVAAYLS